MVIHLSKMFVIVYEYEQVMKVMREILHPLLFGHTN